MSRNYDIIVIGAGSGGLGVSLFAAKVGLKTLLIDRSDEHIGGDCLNFGCVPSKAMVHVSKIINAAKRAEEFGLTVTGEVGMAKVRNYISTRQSMIRQRENADFLRQQGIDVVLGEATFHARSAIIVNGSIFTGKKIVIATGSRPVALAVPGIELVKHYNNESIFDLQDLPKRLLVIGAGPVGLEISQALARLGSHVSVIDRREKILANDPNDVTGVLHSRLVTEGITFHLETEVDRFVSANEVIIKTKNHATSSLMFDAVFVAIGREVRVNELQPEKADIRIDNGKMIIDEFLRTSNKNIVVCGDAAGSLMFSHAAEQHARILINNLFSPVKKRLTTEKMSWVTFTDPELATFGLSEDALKSRHVSYEKIIYDFQEDDRAVVDDYRYGKLILFLTKGNLIRKQRLLGGAMVAPGAGELIQELIVIMEQQLPIDALFDKIYPYPVSSRVNQLAIVRHKEKQLTDTINKLLRTVFHLLN